MRKEIYNNRHCEKGAARRGNPALDCFAVFAMTLLLSLSFGPSVHAQCAATNEGLVAHWKLDETSGNLADSAGTYTGSPINTPTYNSGGMLGAAMAFDATQDERVQVADNDNLDFGLTSFSYGLWVYPTMYDEQWTNPFWKGGSSASYWGYDIEFSRPANGNYAQACIFGSTGGMCSDFKAGAPPLNEWQHFFVVVDRSANQYRTYYNGVLADTSSLAGVGNIDDEPEGSSNNVHLGSGPDSDYFTGKLDDARIYNRALSADEVAAIYALRSTASAPAGSMIYNVLNDNMQYCNGTNWVNAGTGSYNPTGVHFEGAVDLLKRGADLTGLVDGKKVTGSLWFRRNELNYPHKIYHTGADTRFQIQIYSTGEFAISGKNSAGAQILVVAGNTNLNNTNWHHAMFSIDMGNSSANRIYIDGVSQTLGYTNNVNDTIDFTNTEHAVGGQITGPQFPATVADFWLDFNTFIDLSLPENRNKFRSPAGLPMYLGANGSIPTGTSPEIFLSGAANSWHTNKGTGGGFNVTGALSFSSTQPADSLIPSGNIASNLVAYWKMDDTAASTSAAETVGGYNGTETGNLTFVPGGGKIGGSMSSPNALGNYLSLPNNAAIKPTLPATISFWYKPALPTDAQSFIQTEDWNEQGAVRSGIEMGFDGTNIFLQYGDAEGATTSDRRTKWAAATFTENRWYHLVGVIRGQTNMDIYRDGVNLGGSYDGSSASTNVVYSGSYGGKIGGINNSTALDGEIDDVRFYNRDLTAGDVKLLYNCTAPEGVMKYDESFNVMSYCNGAEWVAMGPVGGTPPTNGLVGHWKFDQSSGTSVNDSSGNGYSAGFQGSGLVWQPSGGKVGGALQFGGSGWVEYDDVGNAFRFATTSFSVAAWVKTSGTDMGIVSNTNGTTAWAAISGCCGNEAMGGAYNDAFLGSSSATQIDDGQWHHAVWVFNRPDSKVHYYLDGNADGTASFTPADLTSVGDDLNFGRVNMGGNLFSGMMDDLRIYNRILSPAEISQIYYYGRSGGLGDVSANCSSPNMPEGSMVYNADYNVMQYCNGEGWIGMGK